MGTKFLLASRVSSEFQRPDYMLYKLGPLQNCSEMRICLFSFFKYQEYLVPNSGGLDLWFHSVFGLTTPEK